MQLDQEDRGFSFMKEGPLDMRMDRSENLSAKDVVNTYSEKELGEIFREYGEEKNWRGAARAVVEARRKKPIETTKELAYIVAA
ncbi:MAG: 16S rRNA (cytosine(1402)-N(4))-methyltransferase, partial [Simkania sp.]|nr:16S rRNA (cytosine(1402)-N(4))-methyltransferase [Simkania sp.]